VIARRAVDDRVRQRTVVGSDDGRPTGVRL
jgi:hypothetical protein